MTVLTSVVACLQQSGLKIMAQNKSVFIVNNRLVNKSKQAPFYKPPDRCEKNATLVLIHLLGFAVQVDNNAPFCVKQ